MRKRCAGVCLVFALCISLLAPGGNSRAADRSVRVALPDFAVSLNGHTVDNMYRDYPLLVYHDITYLPMTWYDSRMLGLEANWSAESGLTIHQSRVTSSYMPYRSERRNATVYTADVPDSTITINGKEINNTTEEYPLLSFRNVTYFPLTWRFAHNEFGWDYNWDETDGLRILSRNPQLQSAGLPAYAGEKEVALFQGYYYFMETIEKTNHLYRAPMQQPSVKEEIYSYNTDNLYSLKRGASFQIRDNSLWMSYHIGGNIMGSDKFVRIGGDGKAQLLHEGELDFRETSYGTLIVKLGASAFAGGNLVLTTADTEGTVEKQVGETDLMYSVTSSGTSLGAPRNASGLLAVRGDEVFVLATRNNTDANKIYRINLNTNQCDLIVRSSVSRFQVVGNKLYYIRDTDKILYSSELDGTGEMKWSDHPVSWFDSINGNVYYTAATDTNRYMLYQAEPNGEDPTVWSTPVAEAQVWSNRLICRFGEQDDYGGVLLDSSGRLLLKVADPISRFLPSDQGILLQSAADSSFMWLRD